MCDGAGLDSQLDARGYGQRSGITYLVSAKELLLGHEAILCLQFLGGRFILHGRRRVDRGHWGWSWDRGHRWSGHEGWKDRNKQLCEGGKSPGIRAGENLEGDCKGFLFLPVRGVKGHALPTLAASRFPGTGTGDAAQIGQPGPGKGAGLMDGEGACQQ